MPFEVEDGTGSATSNSYASATEFKDYFTTRRNSAALELSDPEIEANLVLATDYLDNRFAGAFVGTRATEAQALDWPRVDLSTPPFIQVTDEDLDNVILGYIPIRLKYACIEYAWRVATAPLAPDPVINEAGISMVTIEQKVGPLEKKMQPVGGYGAKVQTLRAYPGADMYLRGLVVSANRVIHA
jgi:hypothetical protein